MEQEIKMSCLGLSALRPDDQLIFVGRLVRALISTNKFLINSLHEDLNLYHDMHILQSPSIFLKARWGGKHDKINEAALSSYLVRGRDCIFTADYTKDDCLDTVLQQIIELALEADSLIFEQLNLIDVKFLNRVALAKVMEQVSCIPMVRKNAISFELSSGDSKFKIEYSVSRKAEGLLGGRWKDSPPHFGEFLLGNPEHRNIEKAFNTTKDRANVVVFVTDKKWIDDFNAGKIRLVKGSCIKSKYVIDRSPLGRKFDVYYLTEIRSPVAE